MAEDPQLTNSNGGALEQRAARQQDKGPPDVLLNVENLEVDRIKLVVRNLRAHVSVLAELASLVNLQVGVDARLEEVELEIEGVRAKLTLRADLDNVRAILRHALDTVAEHPEILRILTRALDELVSGLVEDALGTLEDALGSLEVGDTVDELLKGRLEDVRDTLEDVLDQAGEQTEEAAGGVTRQGLPEEPPSTSAADKPSGSTRKKD
jgi:exonuclease VII small subunit